MEELRTELGALSLHLAQSWGEEGEVERGTPAGLTVSVLGWECREAKRFSQQLCRQGKDLHGASLLGSQ